MKMKIKRILQSIFLGCIFSCHYTYAQEINVGHPGTLQDLLLDLQPTSSTLKITGSINGADLNYINNGKGKISAFTELDLSDIKLSPSPHVYATTGLPGGGGGVFARQARFIVSDSCFVDTISHDNGLGGGNIFYNIHTNDMAGAFIENKNFKTVILPSYLDQVGQYTFYRSMIEKVVLPSQAQRICHHAFFESGIKQVEMSSTLQVIETEAFEHCQMLDSLHLPESCLDIENRAFSNSKIRRINLDHVTQLGYEAFSGSELSGSINLEKISRIPGGAFAGCHLEQVKFAKNTQYIGNSAFYENEFKSVSLPEGLKYLGEGAFGYNSYLETMNVPQSLAYVGRDAFPYLWAEQHGELVDGVYYIGKFAYSLSEATKGATVLKFREGTTGIVSNVADRNFFQPSLKEIILPKSLKYIGGFTADYRTGGTFKDCKSLETVTLPENLEFIGASTFENCNQLNITSLPKSLKFIGSRAFAKTKLYQLHLTDNLKVVMDDAFNGCNSLSTLYIDIPSIPVVFARRITIEDLENLNFEVSNKNRLQGLDGVEKIVFSPKVEYVSPFSSLPMLRRVVFEEDGSNKPLTFGKGAFNKCMNLTMDQLPERTVKVGNQAFFNVLFKDSVFHTRNISSIGIQAFNGVKGIKTVYIESKVKEIESRAFVEMPDLHTIYYNSTDKTCEKDIFYGNMNLKKVVFGQDVSFIPQFNYCPKLATVVFDPRPNTNELIFDNYCFSGSRIKQLVLPDCRTIIGEEAFKNNPIQSLKLGNGTEKIGNYAFSGCHLGSVEIPSTVSAVDNFILRRLFFHGKQPPVIGGSSTDLQRWIYVPEGSEAAYKKYFPKDRVIPLTADYLTLDKTQVSLKESEKLQIGCLLTVDPEQCCRIQWKSSNPEIASVDMNGNVTAKSKGKATITASSFYNDAVAAQCEIWVDMPTGIDEAADAQTELQLQMTHSGFKITGALADDLVHVYTLDGAAVMATKAKNVSGLAHGNYLVKVGNRVFKVFIQ